MDKTTYFTTKIHKELNEMFDKLSFPYGKGVYIKQNDEPVYCTYLPYGDDIDLFLDDDSRSINQKVKVTIVSTIKNNYLEAEEEVRNLFDEYGYVYSNGDLDISDVEPYSYIRTLFFNKDFCFKGEDK